MKKRVSGNMQKNTKNDKTVQKGSETCFQILDTDYTGVNSSDFDTKIGSKYRFVRNLKTDTLKKHVFSVLKKVKKHEKMMIFC